jgi:hypothetical protein
MPNLSQKMAVLEKRANGTGADEWSEGEQQILRYLECMSGVPVAKWPPYPYVLDKGTDEVQRRAPAYGLWPKFQALRYYCEGALQAIHQRITLEYQAGRDPDSLPKGEIAEWGKAYSAMEEAKRLLQEALTPPYNEYGGVSSRRGSMRWNTLPTALYKLPHGFARRLATVQLAHVVYSPWRGEWDFNKIKWPPPWPHGWYYRHDI